MMSFTTDTPTPVERFALEPESLPPAQRHVYDAILERRGAFPPPYRTLLASPDVADMVEKLSARLWSGHLPKDVLETAFLATARRFQCQEQWARHEIKAREVGVPADCIRAISRGLKPTGEPHIVVAAQVSKRLLSGQLIGPRLWAQAEREFGPTGIAELSAFLGLASMVAMSINLQDTSLGVAENEADAV